MVVTSRFLSRLDWIFSLSLLCFHADSPPTNSYHDAYEPEFDDPEVFDEPTEDYDNDGYGEGNLQNGMNGHQDYISSGDPAAAAAASGKFKDGKDFDKLAVPKDKRTTTPYMTKYERARLLGTRALQIRYVYTGKN